MKSFNEYLNEKVSNRVLFNDLKDHERFGASTFGKFIIGEITFGSSSSPRTVILDNNWKFDQKFGKGMFVARVANPMTSMKGGYVENAHAIRINFRTGTMSIAQDDDEETGDIVWGKAIKFKQFIVTNYERVKAAGVNELDDILPSQILTRS